MPRAKCARSEAGVKVFNVSPLRDDIAVEAGATWISCVPNSDTALMLGLAHTLVEESLHDQAFIARYCEGWDRFQGYRLGEVDGQARDAEWASSLCGVDAGEIRALARVMASGREFPPRPRHTGMRPTRHPWPGQGCLRPL